MRKNTQVNNPAKPRAKLQWLPNIKGCRYDIGGLRCGSETIEWPMLVTMTEHEIREWVACE